METWRTAFAKQAQSDLGVFDAIGTHPICQQLHYLQMATEKLAKAYLSPADGEAPPHVHDVLVRFLRTCRRNGEIRRAFRMKHGQFGAYVDSLLAMGSAIEDLAPAGGVDRPNPEYPWQQGRGGPIVAPVDYSFSQHRLDGPKMINMLKFVRTCMSVL